MSIEIECKNCHHEHDMRHEKCPVCGGKSARQLLLELLKRIGTGVKRKEIVEELHVITQLLPEDVITEAYLEEHCQLSDVARERVTWEAATSTVEEEAGKKFLAGKDVEASFLRDLAKQFREKANDASKRQDVLLKKQGIR